MGVFDFGKIPFCQTVKLADWVIIRLGTMSEMIFLLKGRGDVTTKYKWK